MARTRTKHNDEQAALILKRQLDALELRRQGLSYRKIGEKLGVSHEQARTDVESELQLLAAANHDKAEENRQLELERLDYITKSLDVWVSTGSAQATNAYLRAMERRAKLLGLDAETKLSVSVNINLVIELVQALQEAGLDPTDTFQSMIQRAHDRANSIPR